jgi:hypothetical protein
MTLIYASGLGQWKRLRLIETIVAERHYFVAVPDKIDDPVPATMVKNKANKNFNTNIITYKS